jgi:regulator of protease activity HflC (stomatin/prohibitin superfamily)
VACLILFVVLLPGFFIVEPNLARALVLFGNYRGTVRPSGFYWTNPFTHKKKISVRAHNLNGKT